MTFGALQRDMRERLRNVGIATAELDARLLLQHAAECDHGFLIAHHDGEVSSNQLARANEALERRLAFEPVSRIVGAREFYGREFAISPAVLDPRPDTEVLVEVALAAAVELAGDCPSLKFADLGTGSGALAVTLLCELEQATGIASDVSPAALEVAKSNAIRHGVAERLNLVCCSWLDGVEGGLDLIVSNPPYIESSVIDTLDRDVKDHDPRLALDGGGDGLAAYRAILPEAYEKLRVGGMVCVEIGASQPAQVEALMAAVGFKPHPVVPVHTRDLAGQARVVTGWKS